MTDLSTAPPASGDDQCPSAADFSISSLSTSLPGKLSSGVDGVGVARPQMRTSSGDDGQPSSAAALAIGGQEIMPMYHVRASQK